jgi:hypothetical protein
MSFVSKKSPVGFFMNHILGSIIDTNLDTNLIFILLVHQFTRRGGMVGCILRAELASTKFVIFPNKTI